MVRFRAVYDRISDGIIEAFLIYSTLLELITGEMASNQRFGASIDVSILPVYYCSKICKMIESRCDKMFDATTISYGRQSIYTCSFKCKVDHKCSSSLADNFYGRGRPIKKSHARLRKPQIPSPGY